MQSQGLSRNSVLRPTPLAACLAAIFALSPLPAIAATTWTVNTCSEANSGSGTVGTLRYAVANAASGDTVDMTGLTCSTISLQTGAVTINQADLTLNGPGMNNLAISGKYNSTIEADRVINHQGAGNLRINDLSIAWGNLSSSTANANGGCIYSKGNVFLQHAGVYLCQARVTGIHTAQGGGIFTAGELSLKYSNLSYNSASGDATANDPLGGGARVDGFFYSKYSAIGSNSASAANATRGLGGGLNLAGSVTIKSSTISANSAGRSFGGIDIFSVTPSSRTTSITNSTISGNSATAFNGGLYVNSGTTTLKNSTVAFNTAGMGRVGAFPFTYYAPGVSISASLGPIAVTLQSTLIANNTYGTASEYDLSVANTSVNTITFNAAPANNLVRATFANVPSDTIKIACPLLGPLRNNGGLTQTHALLSHSPGIDQGNNSAGLNEDQRGIFADAMPYPYPRVDHGQADIGAYEVQQGDIVFNTSFETCPLLF